ncbi:MAG: CobW family GTP-binding protein [Candidatus Hodarchaeota archaeon]
MEVLSEGPREKIKILLISGFLGAGKTTFLKNLLDLYKDEKIGVLMNEFGEVGIDGIQVNDEGIDIVEINDGSIFCSCKHYNFIEALIDISKFPIEILFIESSGVSDTSFMNEDLNIIKGIVGDVYRYLGNICIVDAPNFLEQIEMLEVTARQVKAAHLVFLNKVDTIEDCHLDEMKARLSKLNNSCEIIPTTYCRVSREKLDTLISSLEIPTGISRLKEILERPQKLLLSTTVVLNKEELDGFITKIIKHIYRIKGFCNTRGGWKYIDGVKDRFEISDSDGIQDRTRLVVIFKPDEAIRISIIAGWKEITSR